MVSAMLLFLPHILIKIHATSHLNIFLCHNENKEYIMAYLNFEQGGHFEHKSKRTKKIE